jgi:acetylornithine deacetylase
MDLVDIPSPTGEEKAAAEFLANHFKSMGLKSMLQEIEPERYNAIGRLQGDGTGPTLMFDGHLDTSYSGKEAYLPDTPAYQPKAYKDSEGWVYGLGIYNMKGADACYVAAVDAVMKAGIPLKGDVVIAAVAGEIEMGPVDRFQGRNYRGAGSGSAFMVTHGVTADMCVLGEPSEMRLVKGHMGYVYTKITAHGTPAHSTYAHQAVNAILKATKIIQALDEWAVGYRKRNKYGNSMANVNIAAIEGGWPWRCSRTPVFCTIYVDTRLIPGQHPLDIKREINEVIRKLEKEDPELRVDTDLFMSNFGSEIDPNHYLFGATKAAHKAVFGKEVEVVTEGWFSDACHLSRYGIPSLNYGPSGRTKSGKKGWDPLLGEHVAIEDLYNCAKVYAALILDICTKPREEVLKK